MTHVPGYVVVAMHNFSSPGVCMTMYRTAFAACCLITASFFVVSAWATEPTNSSARVVVTGAETSSSSASGRAVDESGVATDAKAALFMGREGALKTATDLRPFHSLAIQLKAGVAGFGGDFATPLGRKLNLRAGGSYFDYILNSIQNGLDIKGTVQLRTANMNLDWFPFGNAFRITPGVTVYNGNHANAAAMVEGGRNFTLNDTKYTSSTADPVKGTSVLNFGNKVAPSITMGFGNMIPRKGGHWSFPFELGFQYIGPPTVVLNLSGSACQQGMCEPIQSDPQTQANVVGEQKMLTDDLSPARFYPITSIGVSYKFGR